MDKAVILARGLGTRMRQEDPGAGLSQAQKEVARSGIKVLIPLGRPFLDYVLSGLADAGYRRVCLVIGPEHEALRRYCSRTSKSARLDLSFAIQEQALGTADAVAAAEDFADGDSFLTINSDNHYPVEALRALRGLDGPGLAVFERDGLLQHSNIPAARLTRFAVVETDARGRVKQLIENPEKAVLKGLPEPIGVSMNCWRFDAGIFPPCRAIAPSSRGELEITDAVQYAIDELGRSFRALNVAAPVLDLSSREDVGSVAAYLSKVEVRL